VLKPLTVFIAATCMTVALAGATPAFAEDAGYALRFDGTSDLVRLGATSSMMASLWPTTKTASLWLKPTGSAPLCTGPDPGACDAILGDRPRTWGISRGTLGGSDRIWIWNYDGTFDRVAIEYTAGEWIQVALVHEAGVLTAYKNGVLVGSVPSGPTVQSGTQVLYFGGMINNASRNWTFEGEMDELQLWSVARTGAEIAETLNVSLTGGESGLAAYYKMSDGSGTSLTDDSGQGWTGAFQDGGSGVPADGPITWVPSGAFGTTAGPGNTPPVADPQATTTAEDVATSVTLTGSDPDGDALTFRVVSPPLRGTLSGAGADLVYTPWPNVNGLDSFTFVANDGHVDSVAQTALVTILPVDDPPVAADDIANTGMDTAVVVPVLANDTDVDGDTLTVTDVGAPSNGTAATSGTAITYTPLPGFTGTDGFSYTVSDGQGGIAVAQVTVTVRAGQDPGYALQFDGTSDFVTLAPTAYMMAPGWESKKTVSLWVKPTGSVFCNIANAPSCDAIFGDRPRWWGISRGMSGGLDRILVWNYDGSVKQIPVEYVPGEWVHIALVHDGRILTAYKNGVLVGSVPSGPTQQPNIGLPVLHLGGIINTAARNWTFSGEIDEVQIWNAARTPEEIGLDMVGPLQGTEAALAAYYRMSAGSGMWLNDDSGRGWTGELHDGGQGVAADGPIAWVTSGAFTVAP
jgi:hypothetical protein